MSYKETKQVRVEQIIPKDYAEGLAKLLVERHFKYMAQQVNEKDVCNTIKEFDDINEIWHARTRWKRNLK